MREIRISYIHRLRPTIPPLRGIAKEFSPQLLSTLWPAATAVVCPPTFPPQEEVAIALWSPHEATINILTAAANQGRGEKAHCHHRKLANTKSFAFQETSTQPTGIVDTTVTRPNPNFCSYVHLSFFLWVVGRLAAFPKIFCSGVLFCFVLWSE